MSLRKGPTVSKEIFLDRLYGGMGEPSSKIIDVFVSKLRKKLARATGGRHYIETAWGRGYALREPGPMPAATVVAALECVGAPQEETRNAERRTVGQACLPPTQARPPLRHIERGAPRCLEGSRYHPVGQSRTSGIGDRAKVKSVSSPVEMRFEDAVTNDGGPSHLPQPEPARSLFGCAAASCLE